MNNINYLIMNIRNIFYSVITLGLSLLIKRNKNCIAFGSWYGKKYADNSKYFLEYILKKNCNFKIFWVGYPEIKDQLPKDSRIEFINKQNFFDVLKLLRCKYFVCSQLHYIDFVKYHVYWKAQIVHLDHGYPLKKWLDDAEYHSKSPNILKEYIKNIFNNFNGINYKYRYITVSSQSAANNYYTALKRYGADKNTVLNIGTPRNDIILNMDERQKDIIKKEYLKKLGIDEEKKIIVYAPTYRARNLKVKSFLQLNENQKDKLTNILKKYNYIFLEKNHFGTINNNISNCNDIIHIEDEIDTQELLAITDILISDYSGILYDFSLTRKPIIHYIYDYKEYIKDTGLYYDIEEFTTGSVCYTENEVIDEIETLIKSPIKNLKNQEYFVGKFMTDEKGNCCEQLWEVMMSESFDNKKCNS